MTLRLDDLDALDEPIASAAGEPMLLPVDGIDEDPDQPRREFDDNALQELAATIRERGVRQPVSVRPDLRSSGRWILNFGARRVRAARMAGLTTVPAFIDTTADSYDQVIENEQREGLKPLELALFVQKRLAHGDSQAEIARRLGRSRQYVTLATALIEAPDWLLETYRTGKCRGIAELYELRRMHGEQPQAVERWVSERSVVTRDDVAQLKADLRHAVPPASLPVESQPVLLAAAVRAETTVPSTEPPSRSAAQAIQRTNRRLHVEFEGHDYQLVVSVSPPSRGCFYVRPLNGGPRRTAPASELTLRGFVAS